MKTALRTLMVLMPLVVQAQAPDQAWRDRLKALPALAEGTFQVTYQAELTYGGKLKGKVTGERSLDLRLEGNAFRVAATQDQPARTWELPLAGEEDPLKPRTLEAWLLPRRLQALLQPATTLGMLVDGAKLKEVKEDVVGGRMARLFTYRYRTPVPAEFEDRAHTREVTLQVWVGPSGLPLKADIATGYRGRFGRWRPFGRTTRAQWTFAQEGDRLVTRSLDLSDSHLDDWDGTTSLLGMARLR